MQVAQMIMDFKISKFITGQWKDGDLISQPAEASVNKILKHQIGPDVASQVYECVRMMISTDESGTPCKLVTATSVSM